MARHSISLKARRKKVKALAAYSRKYTVRNNTIPKVEDLKLIDIPCTWNTDRTIKATKDSAKWYEDDWYVTIREKALKEIREKTYSKNNKDGKYKFKGKRKPWYMLDSRKTLHYETRKTSWGERTDWFKVPSEAQVMYDKTLFRPKGRAWYMEQVVQHKLAKWEKKNPCPIKKDDTQQDLFEKEYFIPWKEEREKALERIRDFVVSVYDKLPLVGRFSKKADEFEEEQVAELKDKDNEGHNVNELDPKKSKLLKKAQKITNKVKGKRPNLVCTNLKDHKRQKGRIILPKAA